MAKKPVTNPPVETIPSTVDGVSAIASGSAPVVFFDHVSSFGSYNGIAHMTLMIMRFMPGSDGKASRDNVVAAHLRMNFQALQSLKQAISAIEGGLKAPENVSVN